MPIQQLKYLQIELQNISGKFGVPGIGNGRWGPDQVRREDSKYSPSSLQASWDILDTWNSSLGIRRGGGNTKNTTFYHFINQNCCDSRQEKCITAQACQCILQCSRGT
jgi:hypothetical protein